MKQRHHWMLLAFVLIVGLTQVSLAQTVTTEDVLVSIGKTAESQVVLNSAPNGISSYTFTIRLSDGNFADVEKIILSAAFNKAANISISPDANSVTITANDTDGMIGPGAQNVVLATVIFRGTALGKSTIQYVPNQLTDDSGGSVNTAKNEGELNVASGPRQPTIVGGEDAIVVGEQVKTPIILSEAPGQGVKNYRMKVSFGNRDNLVAKIVGVEFIAFNGSPVINVAADGSSVDFGATDSNDAVQSGDVGVILARVIISGQSDGVVDLQVEVNSVENDSGSLSAVPGQNGSISVTSLVNQAPTFNGELPANTTKVQIVQPTLSVDIDDDLEELNPSSIQLTVRDSSGRSVSFNRGSNGALWDGRKFSVNLAQAGTMLAAGNVTVTATATDETGNTGTFTWTFEVEGEGGGTTPPPGGSDSIEAAVAGSDCVIDDSEIRNAITLWILGQEVPGTGQTINDTKIRELITNWILGQRVC